MFWNKSSFETKFFWNDRCAKIIMTTKRKQRKWTATHSKNVWREYLRISSEKKKIIVKKKKMKFRRVFRIICDLSSNLWRLVRWTRIKNHRSREVFKISNLIRRSRESNVFECATNFDFKTRLFFELFFSSTINADLNDISIYNYSDAVVKTTMLIDQNKIRNAFKRCKSNNVSRSNDISNRVLKILMNKLISHLLRLFQACATLKYHSLCFRKTHIIALKKQEKKNYIDIKTYRSIALLNILDKTLKSIVARRISSLAKTHNLLSDNQMNDRKNRSCETALKLFTKQIHTIWNMNKDKMITLLSMNVVEAYDHVSRKRLLHNLKKRKISTWIIVWTNNFMQNWRISLVVSSDTTMMSEINVDISQNSFVFLILYLLYNADLLKLLKRFSRRVVDMSFVNDINIFTYDINTADNCRVLKKMHAHFETWAREHDVVFASIKYELIHLTRNSKKFDMQISVRICDVVKQFISHVRVLNVQIDNKLKWRAHVRSIQKKMIIQTQTLIRLIIFIWKTCFVKTRLIYKIVIRPTVTYDSNVWYASHERLNDAVNTTTKLIKMQQQCLRIINDNFKIVSTQILEIEIFVEFIQLHLIRLQINFKQRMKNNQHDSFIVNFCNRIQSRLVASRKRRRRRANETSTKRKQKWSTKLRDEIRKKNKMNEMSMNKTWHKLFRVKWQQTWNVYQAKNWRRVCETLTENISSKRLSLHKILFKSKNVLVIHMRTRRINLTKYLFSWRVSIVLSLDCICDYSRQTLKRVLLFCSDTTANRKRMFREDETTNLRKLLITAKKLKASVNWLMRINLLTEFSFVRECLK
jgi:hypothetical protein